MIFQDERRPHPTRVSARFAIEKSRLRSLFNRVPFERHVGRHVHQIGVSFTRINDTYSSHCIVSVVCFAPVFCLLSLGVLSPKKKQTERESDWTFCPLVTAATALSLCSPKEMLATRAHYTSFSAAIGVNIYILWMEHYYCQHFLCIDIILEQKGKKRFSVGAPHDFLFYSFFVAYRLKIPPGFFCFSQRLGTKKGWLLQKSSRYWLWYKYHGCFCFFHHEKISDILLGQVLHFLFIRKVRHAVLYEYM